MDDLNLVSFERRHRSYPDTSANEHSGDDFFRSFIVHHHDSSINFNIGDYHRDSFSR